MDGKHKRNQIKGLTPDAMASPLLLISLLKVSSILILILIHSVILSYKGSSGSPASQSDLCYLSDGGSSATFTVNEALPVNSVIGTLQVIGNVSEEEGKSDIELTLALDHPNSRLEGQEVPIRIDSGTKRLVLVRNLDKEGPEGEQGVVVGVKCKRTRETNEPSIIIPVRIIVTDANDHTPEFVGGPYIVNASEVTVVGSPLFPAGRIRAEDEDQQGPFSTIEYYVEPGPYSHMVRFESQFSGNLLLKAPLDFETLPKFFVVIRAQDQGEPPNSAVTTVTVNVIDADDQNPRFLDDKYSATLPEYNRPGEQLVVSPRAIRASDPDTGINSHIEYSFSASSDTREYTYFAIEPKFGDISLKKSLPSSVNLPLTLVVRATQLDNRDRYALTTLTVFNRRHLHLPEIRFLQSKYEATLLENLPPGHVALTVQTTRSEDKTITMSSTPRGESGVNFQILDDEVGHFGIKPNGEIILKKSLDYETRRWYSFRVMVSDGKQSDVSRVNVTLINVNDHDPQFSQSHYNFFISESRLKGNSVVGQVKMTDADVGDTLSLSIRGPFSQVFDISNDGQLKIKSLKSINTTQCHLIVVATDSGSPPRSSSVPVTVQFSSGLFKSFGRSLDDTFIGTGGSAGGKEQIDVNMLLSASSSSAIVLVIVLGVLLATLFIIIITLTVHVLKQRKFSNSSASTSSSDSSGSSSPNQYQNYYQSSRRSSSLSSLGKSNRVGPTPDAGGGGSFCPPIVAGLCSRGVENPIFNINSASTTSNLSSRYYSSPTNGMVRSAGGGGGGSDPDSAIVSDASSSETSNNNRAHDDQELISDRRSSGSISPPPPPSITCTTTGSTGGGTASRISVIKWPQGSIPRRVKKLTWEDEKSHGSYPRQPPNVCQSQGQFSTTGSGGVFGNHGPQGSFGNGNPYASTVAIKSLLTTGMGTGPGLGMGLGQGCPVSASSPDPRHTELDPDVSVTPLRRTVHHQGNSNLPDLTVYF